MLLLHQTPRSCDEYRDVIPLLAEARLRAVAMDTLGFGMSARPDRSLSIELFADAVVDFSAALGFESFTLVGHHTGGVVAIEVAARLGDKVQALVLSGTPYVDAERRRIVAERPAIDLVSVQDDGSHLLEYWNKRQSHYPPRRPDLMHRLIHDALAVFDHVEEGHLAVNRYRMEDRIRHVAVPTLLVCGELDGFSLPDVPKLASAIPGAKSSILPGAGVMAVDHRADLFAAAITDFLGDRTH
ncbi:alpha/beta fold hydrolase [Gordonia desulfuricans]|uniref:alpha/beta fold hydrolase n=1 Tax=Gordonia desulfuricans TaxID=89051 RepID=UPI00192EB4B8|nr:alpha/beta hydrolase [Gordonia desulfuricans]